MNVDDFTKVIKSLAEDLRLPAPTQAGSQFELTTLEGLNLVLDWIAPETLLISYSQSCLGKDSPDFLWNILQANLIGDQHPAITNSGSYTGNLIISWMKIELTSNDRYAVLSHVQRFVGYVEAMHRWVSAFVSKPVDCAPVVAKTSLSQFYLKGDVI